MILAFTIGLKSSCTTWAFMTSLGLHWWNLEGFFRSTDNNIGSSAGTSGSVTGHTLRGRISRVYYAVSVYSVHLRRCCYFLASGVDLYTTWCLSFYHSTVLHNVAVRMYALTSWKSRISCVRVDVLVSICNPWGKFNIAVAVATLSMAVHTTIRS